MALGYEIKAKMIVKAEELSGADHKLLVLSLKNGSKLVGFSLGIDTEADEYEDTLMFDSPDLNDICWFKESQIKDVELA